MSEAPHIPVMLDDVLATLGPLEGKHVVDGTYGAGGYSRAFASAGAIVTGFDRDPDVIAQAKFGAVQDGNRISLVHAPFSQMADHFEPASVEAVVLDIGVSSMQLDQAERGFSFRFDGPLDMRMAQSGASASDVVNAMPVGDLIRVIGILGEEKKASRIAKAIDDARRADPILTTAQLAAIIEKANPRKHSDTIHPATRTFQAIRIFVNDELRELARALFAAESILKPGGVIAVVSFHSLEDRIVKQFLASRAGKAQGSRHLPQTDAAAAVFVQDGKSVISARAAECERNPRARSAKLRAARRTDAPAVAADMSIFKFARLPWIENGVLRHEGRKS